MFGGRDDESVDKCGQWRAEEVEVDSAVDNEELDRDLTAVTRDLAPVSPVALRQRGIFC